ncbi:hypothetical protein BDN70DRAFT_235946 [Pholiota conissans]|uniref:Uncharacterized protein n=1 Tax=Pholiota conissans TaxID=109636 RepID=A0A9P6D0A8_9AGAR|nr:hypothetical protein BDN70DRAFT_235946 [Pholiota conissans]
MEYRAIDFGEYFFGGTFFADDFVKDRITAPIFLCMPDALFDSKGKVSSRVQYALSKALQYQPKTPSVIVSNLNELVVFFPPTWRAPEPRFERVSTTQHGLALQVLTTACLFRELHFTVLYLNYPDFDVVSDLNLAGPPNDPHQELPSDEELLLTHRRNSDFDFVALIHDQARALQFIRWYDLIRKCFSKVVAHPGNTLSAVTNEAGMDISEFQSIYPYDASELPSDTAARLATIHRESPLAAAGVQDQFKQSKSFTVEIDDVIAEGSEYGICTVYRCHLTSIDGRLVLSPNLCLKLFDDRSQSFHIDDEDDLFLREDYIAECLKGAVFGELLSANEVFAYDKLASVQGTIIPWFYGMHLFTLPDGMVLYMDFYSNISTLGNLMIGIQSCYSFPDTLEMRILC